MTPNIIINDELHNLLPPLSEDEYTELEASILADGVLTPLVVWDGILVDGHYRYVICVKHSIPFTVHNMIFDSLEDAKIWMWKNQIGRRNLSMFHRSELALKLKDAIAAKAKDQQLRANMRKKLPGKAIDTRREIGKLAGVSRNTIQKVEFLMEHADDATKNKLRSGEKGISISSEYNRLSYGDATYRSECPGHCCGLRNVIPMNVDPKALAEWLLAHFPDKTCRKLACVLLSHFLENDTANESETQ